MNTLEMTNGELVYFRDHIEKRAKSIRYQETSRLLTLIHKLPRSKEAQDFNPGRNCCPVRDVTTQY